MNWLENLVYPFLSVKIVGDHFMFLMFYYQRMSYVLVMVFLSINRWDLVKEYRGEYILLLLGEYFFVASWLASLFYYMCKRGC